MNSYNYKNESNRMVILKCMAENFWIEKVIMPFETYIFDAPSGAEVEIFGLDQSLWRHYRVEELQDATFSH